MKRISLLLVVIVVMALGSVDAFACKVCTLHLGQEVCVTRAEGAQFCTFSGESCIENGVCPAAAPVHTALATQYTVASVERLDEQRPVTSPVKTAHLAAKPAHQR